ncbi:prepilin-type N-terminal cleavage/methylation domain-containing protein [Bradyrhizobium lablabi]|uniref:type IV pilus modification PilV family protein n=1 Tax=Bradyrhizobium lablabi TaxID=722472 RepID=UPI001BA863AE|nr:prepilin-type N-terminal cleavage/methylation domain-containing protein [Bradyrhizobium lablabi]MBR0697764.1 prepilin-type N-terminal cleavage/methylation domain-containing protein [Bradyrhizobium lablabi]
MKQRRLGNRPVAPVDGRCSERGFSLLEVLIAFVVLAIGLGAMTMGVALAMRSDLRTHVGQGALRVAQSRLEAAGVSEALVPGQREGRVGRRYRWRQTTVEALPSTLAVRKQDAEPSRQSAAIRTFWVTVVVNAGSGTTVQLAALKVAPEPKP